MPTEKRKPTDATYYDVMVLRSVVFIFAALLGCEVKTQNPKKSGSRIFRNDDSSVFVFCVLCFVWVRTFSSFLHYTVLCTIYIYFLWSHDMLEYWIIAVENSSAHPNQLISLSSEAAYHLRQDKNTTNSAIFKSDETSTVDMVRWRPQFLSG